MSKVIKLADAQARCVEKMCNAELNCKIFESSCVSGYADEIGVWGFVKWNENFSSD